MSSPKRIEFDAPDGWTMPEGKAVGEDIELVATVRVKPDGRLCLVELDGNHMPGYKDEEDDKTYAQASADSMDKMHSEQGGY